MGPPNGIKIGQFQGCGVLRRYDKSCKRWKKNVEFVEGEFGVNRDVRVLDNRGFWS